MVRNTYMDGWARTDSPALAVEAPDVVRPDAVRADNGSRTFLVRPPLVPAGIETETCVSCELVITWNLVARFYILMIEII